MTALEKVANVCVIVAAVAVTGGTVYDRFLGPKLG